MRPSLAVEESLRALGTDIRSARLKRRLPQAIVAERSGISLNTLSKIEKGDPGVSIGNIASVLQSIGLLSRLTQLASAGEDEAGLLLEERNLPQRIRLKKKPAAL
ncbi:helix-turn-helix domain-containing protein [Sutterella sp.]|uniref:helix-turn-helix domain-containing protein n=1 Tax=Sutterella sp. TaxID=1981025 RepID=UPI0026DF4EF4|nr:helix-turn-helix transcriptional regulator [Sutterella sp.]MDO5532543.1 helix-turn-helix transcriptional regulator [Sutterella sp.]